MIFIYLYCNFVLRNNLDLHQQKYLLQIKHFFFRYIVALVFLMTFSFHRLAELLVIFLVI